MLIRNYAFTAALGLALLAVGCKSPEAQLEGKWKFSDIKLAAGNANAATAKAQLSSSTAEFKPDKTFTMTVGFQVEGTWAISGHAVSLTLTKVMGQDISKIKQQLQAISKGNPNAANGLAALDKPLTATLADDGKTLTVDPSEGKQGQLIMTKAEGS